jgi:hypothetical protein
MRREDRIASGALVVGLGATITAMALPLAYPHTPVIIWRLMLFGGIGLSGASLLFLAYDLIPFPRRQKAQNSPLSDQEKQRFEWLVMHTLPELKKFIDERTDDHPLMESQKYSKDRFGRRYNADYNKWFKQTNQTFDERFAKDMAEIGRLAIDLGLLHRNEIDLFIKPVWFNGIKQAAIRLEAIARYIEQKGLFDDINS